MASLKREAEDDSFKLLHKEKKIPRVTTDDEFAKKLSEEILFDMQEAEESFVYGCRTVDATADETPIWKEFYERLEKATKAHEQELIQRDQMIEKLERELREGNYDDDEKAIPIKLLQGHRNQKATEQILAANQMLRFCYEEWNQTVEFDDGKFSLADASRILKNLSDQVMELRDIFDDLQQKKY